MTAYDSSVAQLYELGHELARTSGHKFDLELVRTLLGALGHPERQFPSVLIAGTNGKGSTAATLASILQAGGYRTGLYTSPHLLRVNERIRVNGQDIDDEAFALIHDHVERVAQKLIAAGELPWHPSFFEVLTAMAFSYFASLPVDIAVLEVGMGGRLDATNVVDPLVSVICDISLDHQKFLGNTIREIAGEKAGIIRPGGVVVTLPQHPEANEVIGNTVLERGATVISAVPFIPPLAGNAVPAGNKIGLDKAGNSGSIRPNCCQHQSDTGAALRNRYRIEVMGETILVDSPLVGRHQWRNIALAIASAEQLNRLGMKLTPENVASGIFQTAWRGRFQVVPADSRAGIPEIVLDGAHNPAGAWALRSALSQAYAPKEGTERRLIFVFGAMRDKAIGEIASILFPLAQHVVLVRADNPRSAAPEEIRDLVSRIIPQIDIAATVPVALERACSLALQEDAVVVIAGSIYLVGEAMAVLSARKKAGA